MIMPISAMSGGLIQPCCQGPNKNDLLKPPTSAEGAAAQVQADEADAPKRRAAVRYLGTVDCRYWPDVSVALKNALRADKIECVRYEAALALGRGCCCNKVTMDALTNAISDAPKDDLPVETSERVREAAMMALNGCLAKVPAAPPTLQKEGGKEAQKEGGKTTNIPLTPDLLRVQNTPAEKIIVDARKAVQEYQTARTAMPSREPGLFAMFSNSMSSPRMPRLNASVSSQPAEVVVSDRIVSTTVTPVATPAPREMVQVAPPAPAVSEFPAPGATQVTVEQMLAVLAKSNVMEQREWAAEQLSLVDWKTNPKAVQCLVSAARVDSSTTVRVACIRSMANMGANTNSVKSTLQTLKGDRDNRVRNEAMLALNKLANGSSIQPASANVSYGTR
jgi:hypothetical protein